MRIALALFLIGFAANAAAQNLVPNPSFEEYLECPYSTAEFQTQVVDWYSFAVTPDYFHVCSNDLEGYAGVPENAWGNQQPVGGDAYAGVITYTHTTENEREYIACPLNEPLEEGQDYYIMFYTSFYDGGDLSLFHCATNHMGLKFFQDPSYGPETDERYWPQNESDIELNQMLIDSTSWTLVDGWFTADSTYDWIAIGNFYDDDNTSTVKLGDKNYCYGLYFIDNICVASSPEECESLLQVNTPLGENLIEIFPNPISSYLNIHSDKKLQEICVVDLSGKVIYRNTSPSVKVNINSNDWAKGMYVVHAQFQDGALYQSKIIK